MRINEAMVLETFVDRLDALGADVDRWPGSVADEAYALLARSPEARAAHARARRFDGLVAQAAQASVPNGFAFRVVGEIAARRNDRLSWLTGAFGSFGLAGASFCAAALAIGVALGAAAGPARAGLGSIDLGVAYEVSLADVDL